LQSQRHEAPRCNPTPGLLLTADGRRRHHKGDGARLLTGDFELVGRTRRAKGLVAGLLALAAIGSIGYVRAAGGERTLSLYNIHTKETVTAAFKRDGKFLADGLEKLSWALRDWRRNEATKMDPELIDLLWEIHNELGSNEAIHIISGYRSRTTNNMLRATVGGQASESRHILGKAADVHFPDVPLVKLRYSALIRERGGVGYYPTSAIPFVHVDTDRVRAWPRLPRHELALLFPGGSTRHMPADGGPITRDDVRIAKTKYGTLAQEIASFQAMRSGSRVAVADARRNGPAPDGRQTIALATPPAPLSDPLPQLLVPPRPLSRQASLPSLPSDNDRAVLASLSAAPLPQLVREPQPAARRIASLGGFGPASSTIDAIGQFLSGGSTPTRSDIKKLENEIRFAAAPEWDEEHPDELAYRPFPIAPLMTATASADDPALVHMVAPDASRTLEVMEQPGTALPLRFRPGQQTAQLLWAQQFTGEAVSIERLFAGEHAGPPAGNLTSRPVRTTNR